MPTAPGAHWWPRTLRDAQQRGEIDPAVDADLEATALVALVDGLAVQAMFEPRASRPSGTASSTTRSTSAWRVLAARHAA